MNDTLNLLGVTQCCCPCPTCGHTTINHDWEYFPCGCKRCKKCGVIDKGYNCYTTTYYSQWQTQTIPCTNFPVVYNVGTSSNNI